MGNHSLSHIFGVIEKDRCRFGVSLLRAQLICQDQVNIKVDLEDETHLTRNSEPHLNKLVFRRFLSNSQVEQLSPIQSFLVCDHGIGRVFSLNKHWEDEETSG
jgi:hypothetical protein